MTNETAEPSVVNVSAVRAPAIIAMSIKDACECSGLERDVLYAAIASGALESLEVGRRRLIVYDSLRSWLLAHKRAGISADRRARAAAARRGNTPA